MDARARGFIDAYYSDYLDAVRAVTEVFKAYEMYETSPDDAVRNLFLMSGLTYVHYCGEEITSSLACFIIDLNCYLDESISEWIHELNASRKREVINDYIRALLDQGFDLSLQGLSETLKSMLDFCKTYDDAVNSNVRQSLTGALTRYAYLLIKTDDIITRKEEEFYSLFKVGLSKALSSPSSASHSQDISIDASTAETSTSKVTPEEELARIMKDVDAMIGLDNIKKEVSDLLNLLKVQQMRRNSGLAAPETSKHMVFYGNPGTGKTTIARKLAEIYKTLGVLSRGHLVETDRSSLVAGYLGQTAIKTKQVLEAAKGGILFIDEAYALSQEGGQDQYGQESIDTILKFMEDNRDDLIVIVAGYELKMAGFIEANPGLKSRFSKYFYFPDYTALELAAIFAEMAARSQYHLTSSFANALNNICELMIARKSQNFGNGRTIRNLFERCISNQANRVVSISNPSAEELSEFSELDLSIQDLEHVMR